ncbi:MAG: hypothetical protein D6730_06390 [Bacteroidetes bacterium]|nr:MAG: hypothetical protein D6730_06390 [Bacteroidota bacterium]
MSLLRQKKMVQELRKQGDVCKFRQLLITGPNTLPHPIVLVQYYFPHSLSPARLDRYLASGWFRSASMLYRLKLVCMEGDFHSPVNIRLKLGHYHFKKRLRKIMRRNESRFRVEIGRASINQHKERLYQQQKHRFRGFVFESLLQFLQLDAYQQIFDTYEVCVYEGSRLVALSYFDMGQHSIASLIGLFDQAPAYKKYSLGLYTMLVEIDYALACGKRYYYPGYVLDRESEFVIKLRLGDFEFYNWKGRWRPMEKFREEPLLRHLLQDKISALKACLRQKGIPYKQWLYPFFSIGYLEHHASQLVRSVVFISCFPASKHQNIIIEYNVEEEIYQMSKVAPVPNYDELIETAISVDFLDPEVYWPEVLGYECSLYRHAQAEKMAESVLAMYNW